MPVNAFLVHGPDGVVVVDGMLTVTDAALVRQAIDDTGYPLAGVVVTHPHPPDLSCSREAGRTSRVASMVDRIGGLAAGSVGCVLAPT